MKVMRITPGLGNQMFQYALLAGYQLKREEVGVDISPCLHSKKHNSYELENIFSIKVETISILRKIFFVGPYFYIGEREITLTKLLNKIVQKTSNKELFIKSEKYVFDKLANSENNFSKEYLELSGDKYISGYFCSWKYFSDIEDYIKRQFTFPDIEAKDVLNSKLLSDIQTSESVSIHVRRGDYVGGNLELQNDTYFKNAYLFLLEQLTKKNIPNDKIQFFIFSDDIDWCKKNLLFLGDKTTYVDWNRGKDSYRDMQLMSECKHNIIPNSTFSWWSAYLNKNQDKVVVSPVWWAKGKRMSRDRIPPSWFLVE